MRIRETMTCEKGFTLVELLVVIGIIGILAMLLLPQFSGMRDRARIASCQSNLKNIGTQIEAFYADMERYPTDTSIAGSEWTAQFATLEIASCSHDKTLGYVYMAPATLATNPATGALAPTGTGPAPANATIFDFAADVTGGGGVAGTRIDSYLVYCQFHDGTGYDHSSTPLRNEAAETQLFITNNGLQRWPQ